MRVKFAAIGLALLAVLGIGTAGATSDRGPGPASRLDLVQHRGEIRVCSTGDYRPFTYRDPATGRWSGIDVDLAGDLAQRLGVRLTVVPTTWKKLVDDLGRACDLAMGGISVTLDRAKRAFFSTPYVRDGKTPITRCENAERFGTLEQIDQPGVRAIVNPGGTNEQFADANLHRATIVRHPDNNTIFEEIIAGRADLMITDATETRWQAKQHPELCAVHPDRPFTFAEKAYLLPRGDVVFQEFVNQWLHLAQNDGTYDRIAKPWLG
ncbi:transporter substrate-binding domain-containing protein [Amycolatopsis anabasis]|uniref:transporter substrate-binding domain-containing protein n=1 Tax=Amycolatopsis anabasis TaxID=1840409 RepID=UPI00131CB969|nr:transporter substrate-binding domain-containing protein [Amycolatopsis anabasis]